MQFLAATETSPYRWAALLLWHPQDGNFVGLTSRMADVESRIWQSIRGEEKYRAKPSNGCMYATRPCLPDLPVAIIVMNEDGFATEWLMDPQTSADFIADSKMRKKFTACVNAILKAK